MTNPIRIGVIGGSGVYRMEALQDVEEISLETPFRRVGQLRGGHAAQAAGRLLARHRRGHRISPSPRQLPRPTPSTASKRWAWSTSSA
ncbi:MAG: hypothetical protein R3A10_17460 [Caldilineaceae bacterium]